MACDGRLVLTVNPGGTSTKLGLFRETELIFQKSIRHLPEELEQFDSTLGQLDYRRDMILAALEEEGYGLEELTAVVGRGGAFKPLESGTYEVNSSLVEDIREGSTLQADHPSNLGALLAWEIALEAGCRPYIVDPVCVDEMIPEARLSGLPQLERISLSHALNIRMVAYKAAEKLGRKLQDLNMVVLHLGSGISVNAIRKGRMIDTSQANDGGPFSPQRVGALPTTGLAKMCLSGRYTWPEMKVMLLKRGGLFAYTGTDHVGEALERAREGDEICDLALRAMAYQIIKEAGAMAAALAGDIDAVVITGGIAINEWMTERISRNLKHLAEIIVFPGEEELEALMRGVFRVLDSVEDVKIYR
ncbi:MAG: butyrate kinase [Candidatus Fermentibacteraceae bacterium]|nr:butyrate kinase [Candidatus Fermentibacteraceae bacterium]MBN2609566.1 butyrate kinase [Candidatus Fermentibacteraceae bacterium]